MIYKILFINIIDFNMSFSKNSFTKRKGWLVKKEHVGDQDMTHVLRVLHILDRHCFCVTWKSERWNPYLARYR